MPPLRSRASSALTLVTLAASAFAHSSSTSVVVVEIEPNGAKIEANVLPCIAAGSKVQGVSTGSSVALSDSSLTSADTYLVATCPLPPGIFEHRLVLTTLGPEEHALTVRGLLVNGPSASPTIQVGSDTVLQSAVYGMGLPKLVQWYGFGRGEELFARVSGTTNTVLPYEIELVSTPVAPLVIPTALRTGSIEITTVGQGHNTDTEIVVFDAAFTAIPGFRNDDDPVGSTTGSRLTRNFAAGLYYVAVARFNVADSALTGFDDDYQLAPVLDLPDGLISWSPSGSPDVSFAITDSLGTLQIPAFLGVDAFEIAWFRIAVTDPPVPATPVCFGDGSGTPCPCGNSGAPGRGCANSVNSSGGLLATTGFASVSADSLVLLGSGMPTSSALYFQGTSVIASGNGQVFGDGKRCTGGEVLRIDTATNFGGISQYPGAGDPGVSVRGFVPITGGMRVYQIWYRNPDPGFCTPSFFNLTNALSVTWIS